MLMLQGGIVKQEWFVKLPVGFSLKGLSQQMYDSGFS